MDIREFKNTNNNGTVINQIPTSDVNDTTTMTSKTTPVNMDSENNTVDVVNDETVDMFLTENNIPKVTIFAMLDKLITDGTCTYDTSILGTISVGFKVRYEWMNDILLQALEDEEPKTVARFQEMVARYNLAGSLYKYQKTEYDIGTKELYFDRLRLVTAIATPIYGALVEKLSIFDKLVRIVSSEWAIKNFTKPPLVEPAQK